MGASGAMDRKGRRMIAAVIGIALGLLIGVACRWFGFGCRVAEIPRPPSQALAEIGQFWGRFRRACNVP
jgi:NhaP-type Na+/H+ or K+/H+ antiporter